MRKLAIILLAILICSSVFAADGDEISARAVPYTASFKFEGSNWSSTPYGCGAVVSFKHTFPKNFSFGFDFIADAYITRDREVQSIDFGTFFDLGYSTYQPGRNLGEYVNFKVGADFREADKDFNPSLAGGLEIGLFQKLSEKVSFVESLTVLLNSSLLIRITPSFGATFSI